MAKVSHCNCSCTSADAECAELRACLPGPGRVEKSSRKEKRQEKKCAKILTVFRKGIVMTTTVTHEQFITDAKGRKTGIILSLSRYEKLMEDLHDLAIVAERRDERLVSLDEMKKRLKNDGVL